MKHAFLIEAHDSPELLRRIINILKSENHFIFLHIDKNSQIDINDFSDVECIGNDQRIAVKNGGFSQIAVENLLLRKAFQYPVKIDYFHLISGHDYPCRSMNEFDSFFEKVNLTKESFMHYDTDEEHDKWLEKISNRVNLWWFDDDCYPGFITRFLERLLNLIMPRSFSQTLYAGWNWFSWHRDVVKCVISYWDNNPSYVNRFHHTSCCDEVFYHTMLFNQLETLNINRNNACRYIDWHPTRKSSSLPLVLDERDYLSIRSSGKFFCRKVFLGKSSILLDMLDKDIL